MKILVTGSRGQVGKAIFVRGAKYGFNMVGYSKEDLDITSKKMSMMYLTLKNQT